jgi:hypothetical protein
VHPGGIEGLDPVHDVADRVLIGEDADLAVEVAHRGAEVLVDRGRLVARLDVEVGGEHAARRLVVEHHRVPVVHVRRLQEAQAMRAEVQHLAVDEAPHLPGVVPPLQVEPHGQRAAHERRLGGLGEEAVHAAALVRLEVQERDVGQPRGVEHLRHGVADALVEVVHPRVYERGALVVDQELVEGDPRGRHVGRDPVGPLPDVVDPRAGPRLAHGSLSLALGGLLLQV